MIKMKMKMKRKLRMFNNISIKERELPMESLTISL